MLRFSFLGAKLDTGRGRGRWYEEGEGRGDRAGRGREYGRGGGTEGEWEQMSTFILRREGAWAE